MSTMSRCSSENSLNGNEEEQSTVSSKTSGSGPRKSLDSMIAGDRARIQSHSDEHGSSDLQDMPSLTSFRFDDASTVRTEGELSLPSLSSYRNDEISMSSSYHSTHMSNSEGSENWNSTISFNSGTASQGGGSQDTEFGSSDGGGSSLVHSRNSSIERQAPLRTESMPQKKSASMGKHRSLSPPSAANRGKVADARRQGRLMGFKGNEPIISILKKPRPISPMRNNEDESPRVMSPKPPRRNRSSDGEPLVKPQKYPIKSALKSSAGPNNDEVIRLPGTRSNKSSTPMDTDSSKEEAPKPPSRRNRSPERNVERASSMPLSSIEHGRRRETESLAGSSSSFRMNNMSSSSFSTGTLDTLPKVPRRMDSRASNNSSKKSSRDEDGVVIVISKNSKSSSSPRSRNIKKRLSSEQSLRTAETEKLTSEENDDDEVDDDSEFSHVDGVDDDSSDSSVSVDSEEEVPLGLPLKSRPASSIPPAPADTTPTMAQRRRSIEQLDDIEISASSLAEYDDSDDDETSQGDRSGEERPAIASDDSAKLDNSPSMGRRRTSLTSNEENEIKAALGSGLLEKQDAGEGTKPQSEKSHNSVSADDIQKHNAEASKYDGGITNDEELLLKSMSEDNNPGSPGETEDVTISGRTEDDDVMKATSLVELIVKKADDSPATLKCEPVAPAKTPEGINIDASSSDGKPPPAAPTSKFHAASMSKEKRGSGKLRKALSSTLKGIARASSFRGGSKHSSKTETRKTKKAD